MPRSTGPVRAIPLAIAAGILAVALPVASIAETRAPARMAAMTPEEVQTRAKVIDDHLELETIISTETAFRSTRGLFATPFNDNHLRAAIDKRTGAVRYEVRQNLSYSGVFRNFGEVSYQTTSWPVTAPVTRLADNAAHCAAVDMPVGCFEELTFTVSEDQLRGIAADYSPTAPDQWAFKFRAANGLDWRAGVMRAEVAGLLRAVDDHKRRAGLTGPLPAAAQ